MPTKLILPPPLAFQTFLRPCNFKLMIGNSSGLFEINTEASFVSSEKKKKNMNCKLGIQMQNQFWELERTFTLDYFQIKIVKGTNKN